MTVNYQTLLDEILAVKQPGLPDHAGRAAPAYGGQSLLNLPDSIARWLGLEGPGQLPLRADLLRALGGPFRRVVLLLVDGLRLDRLHHAVQESSPGVWGGRGEAIFTPLTSVSPSTTVAALTSLWTGASPARHGLAGYELWLKEFGVTANMILQSPASFSGSVGGLRQAGFDPQTFLPAEPLGALLSRQGGRVEAFMHQAIARSGLSEMHLPAVELHPFRTLADLLVSLGERLEQPPDRPEYLYGYWGDIDELSHRFGPHDRRIELEFERFSALLQRELLARPRRGDTLLVVTADHGLIHTPRDDRYDLRWHPELTRRLHILPTGENRLAFLHIRPGEVEAVEQYFAQAWPGEFDLLDSAAVLESGLFGPEPPYSQLTDRVGERIALARGNAYLWWARKDNPMLGRHGGLSQTEMLIPLWMTVI